MWRTVKAIGIGALAVATMAAAPQGKPPAAYSAAKWDRSHAGQPLDLTGYTLTFEDEFNRPSITDAKGKGPWFAPARSDFGAAHFEPPGWKGPFFVKDGILRIRAEKDAAGKWRSGHMQTMAPERCGFAQQYGYFEMRGKMPASLGSWGGFWVKSANEFTDPADNLRTRAEIDIIEHFGAQPDRATSAAHLWPRGADAKLYGHVDQSTATRAPGLTDAFHDYGLLVTPEIVIISLDKRELARWPTLPEQRQPLYLLLSLTLQPQFAAQAVSPIELLVDRVRVFKSPVGPGAGQTVGGCH